jgi:hypothetical protein
MEKKIFFMQTEINGGNTAHIMANDKEKELNIMKVGKQNLNAFI